SAAKALGEYVTEARPIVARLKELQVKATTFTGKIAGDEHWKDDGDKIDENNDLIHDVNAAVSAFWAAERTCANKIRGLYCAPPLTTDDGSHGANMYGYKGEDLDNAQDLPWGSQLEETHRAWEIGYWVKSFVWDGLIVDG
ncbi:protein phosphatase, partial [Streptomyces sp. SID12501]|nr:protein phosphatase [Streptomyces sp. SID12501]